MKIRIQKIRKLIAFATVCLFTSQTVLWSAPAVPSAAALSTGENFLTSESLVRELMIPENLGRIDERYVAPDKNAPVLIHIQDAHALPEAQRHIQTILEYLTGKQYVRTIAVESAFGTLEPAMLDIFEDADLNKAFAETLLEMGELTGVELFAVNHPEFSSNIRGAEDQRLYRESFLLFKEIKQAESEWHSALEGYKVFIEQLELKVFRGELLDYALKKSQWQGERDHSIAYLDLIGDYAAKFLDLNLRDPRNQFEWPSVTRLFAVSDLEKEQDFEQARQEKDDLIAALQQMNPPAVREYFQDVLNHLFSGEDLEDLGFLRSPDYPYVQSLRTFFEFFRNRTHGSIELLRYPHFLKAAGAMILRSELDAVQLFNELDRLESAVEKKLVKSKGEKELLDLREGIGLIEKLLSLKMSRENFEDYKSDKANLLSGKLSERLGRFHKLVPQTKDLPQISQSLIEKAERFYVLSVERDQALFLNTLDMIRKGGSQPSEATVLISGGFHTQGLTEHLKDEKISHLVISPRISELIEDGLYEKAMLGANVPAELVSQSESAIGKILALQSLQAYQQGPLTAADRQLVFLKALQTLVDSELSELSPADLYQLLRTTFASSDVFSNLNLIYDETAGTVAVSVPVQNESRVFFLSAPRAQEPDFYSGPQAVDSTVQSVAVQPAFGARFRNFLAQNSRRVAGILLTGVSGAVTAETASSRSELRALEREPDVNRILGSLPQSPERENIDDAIANALRRKNRRLEDAAQISPANRRPGSPFRDYVRDTEGSPSRQILGIEEIANSVIQENNLGWNLPIAHRFAFALTIFDSRFFPEVNARLLDFMQRLDQEQIKTKMHLTTEEYIELTRAFSKSESQLSTVDHVLFKYAINKLVIGIPRQEREAIEKEYNAEQMIKELENPGSGDIPTMVFMTDLHGSTRVGSLIAAGLGIENYQGVTSVEILEERLIAQWKKEHPSATQIKSIDEILAEKNVIFVGGSDYVDRGPKPYWGFQFNEWLRRHGILRFINGNHDLWKDWNVIGFHLRVQDTLRNIAESGRYEQSDVAGYVDLLWPFVTTINWDNDKVTAQRQGLTQLVQRFIKVGHEGRQYPAEMIEGFADQVLEMGTNENHSLEWWSREWGIHGGWFDTFLDQINEESLNEVIGAINSTLAASPNARERLSLLLNAMDELIPTAREALQPFRDAMLKQLETGNSEVLPLFDIREFFANPAVSELKKTIAEIKDRNKVIREKNQRAAAENRFGDIVSQERVPSAFDLTGPMAQARYDQLKQLVQVLNGLELGVTIELPDMSLATVENYRRNPKVMETVLWNLKNFRLVYVDALNNIYLHGIIPINHEDRDFAVTYETSSGQILHGINAIERIQYDVRRFFDQYDEIPDTAEFRERLEREIGPAMRILNHWYSDTTAELKPEKIELFLKSGGPASYPFDDTNYSIWNDRVFKGTEGVWMLGHVESAKLRKAGISYWHGGMEGGLLHGDFEMSEGYSGLGAVVTWFARDKNGHRMGARRLGYAESVGLYQNNLKKFQDDLKKIDVQLQDQALAQTDREAAEKKRAGLTAKIDAAKAAIQRLQTDGEVITDITIHDDISAEAVQQIKPFIEGEDLLVYYIERFFTESIQSYKRLNRDAVKKGRGERRPFYEMKIERLTKKLKEFRERRIYQLLNRNRTLLAQENTLIDEIVDTVRREDYTSALSFTQNLSVVIEQNNDGLGAEVLEKSRKDIADVSALIERSAAARNELREDLPEYLQKILREKYGIEYADFTAEEKRVADTHKQTLQSALGDGWWIQRYADKLPGIVTRAAFASLSSFEIAFASLPDYAIRKVVDSERIDDSHITSNMRFLNDLFKPLYGESPDDAMTGHSLNARKRALDYAREALLLNESRGGLDYYAVELMSGLGPIAFDENIQNAGPAMENNISTMAINGLQRTPGSIPYIIKRIINTGDAGGRQYLVGVLGKVKKQPDKADLKLFFPSNPEIVDEVVYSLNGYVPGWEEWINSKFFVPASSLSGAERRLRLYSGLLSDFASHFSAKDLQTLIDNWGLHAVSNWAAQNNVAKQKELYLFLASRQRDGRPLSRILTDVIEAAGDSEDPVFSRKILFLLLEGGVFPNKGVVALLSVVMKDPPKYKDLMAFLIVLFNMKLFKFDEEEFIQESISNLLNSEIEEVYYLARKLAAAIPHPTQTGDGLDTPIRFLSAKLDDFSKVDRGGGLGTRNQEIFRTIRLELHSDPSTMNNPLLRTMLDTLLQRYHPDPKQRIGRSAVAENMQKVMKQNKVQPVTDEFETQSTARVAKILWQRLQHVGASNRGVDYFINGETQTGSYAVDPRASSSLNMHIDYSYGDELPDWEGVDAELKESPEYFYAVQLVRVAQAVNRRYSVNPRRITIISKEAYQLAEEQNDLEAAIRKIIEKRQSIGKMLLTPGLELDPWMDIHRKRHQSIREGYAEWGFTGTYQESKKFDPFEDDRVLEAYSESLHERFLKAWKAKQERAIKEWAKQKRKSKEGLDDLTRPPLPLRESPMLDAEVREPILKLVDGTVLLLENLILSGVSEYKLKKFHDILKNQQGMDVQMLGNILAMIQDEIIRMSDDARNNFGGFPGELAQTLGNNNVNPRYQKTVKESDQTDKQWAARVEETLLADLLAGDRNLAILNNYLTAAMDIINTDLRPFSYHLVREAPALEGRPHYITSASPLGNLTAIDIGSKFANLKLMADQGFNVPPFVTLLADLPERMNLETDNKEFRMVVINALLDIEEMLINGHARAAFPFGLSGLTDTDEVELVRSRRAKTGINEDTDQVLLISARSGSFISMPGMMDTVLNLPLTREVLDEIVEEKGVNERFAKDIYRRLLTQYGVSHYGLAATEFSRMVDEVKKDIGKRTGKTMKQISVKNDFTAADFDAVIQKFEGFLLQTDPNFYRLDPLEMVLNTIRDIYASWDGAGAASFRRSANFSPRYRTGVGLQWMVFGNENPRSGTAVVESSDPALGVRVPEGAVKYGAQGTDVVSGTAQSDYLTSIRKSDAPVYQGIVDGAMKLEKYFGGISQDIELTWVRGSDPGSVKVYWLQSRDIIQANKHARRVLKIEDAGQYKAAAIGKGMSSNAAVGRLVDARLKDYETLRAEIKDLRDNMDSTWGAELDIILLYEWFTDQDAGTLIQLLTEPGADYKIRGILTPKSTINSHAVLIARKQGLAMIGNIDSLDLSEPGVVKLAGEDLEMGVYGPIIAMDGYPETGRLASQTSGMIFWEGDSIESEIIEPQSTFKKSELREAAPRSEMRTLEFLDSDQVLNMHEFDGVLIEEKQTGDGSVYFTSRPVKGDVDVEDSWQVQSYFRNLYNALNGLAAIQDYGFMSPQEIQLRDDVFARYLETESGKSNFSIIKQDQTRRGFVSQIDLFRLLAKMRGKALIQPYQQEAMSSLRPAYQIALLVNPKRSNLEPALMRALLGRNDLSLKVVLGVTASQLNAILSSSKYRRFLSPDQIRFNDQEGWIEILGKRIRVEASAQNVKDEWQELGIQTVVSTYDANEYADRLGELFEDGHVNIKDLRFVSVNDIDAFGSRGPPDEARPNYDANTATPEQQREMLREKRVLLSTPIRDVPAIFYGNITANKTFKGLSPTFSFNFLLSPFSDQSVLDQSGRQPASLLNTVRASRVWKRFFRKVMRNLLTTDKGRKPVISEVDLATTNVQTGDMVKIKMAFDNSQSEKFIQQFSTRDLSTLTDSDLDDLEDELRDAFLKRVIDKMDDREFAVKYAYRELRQTDARLERKILIDRSLVDITVERAQDGSFKVDVKVPLVFNRDWQNVNHLLKTLETIAEEEQKNLPLRPAVEDLRRSIYGLEVARARQQDTLPPQPYEIPAEIEQLTHRPLRLGIVAPHGQIGVPTVRQLISHLNLALVAATGPKTVDEVVNAIEAESVQGPFIVNGTQIPVTGRRIQKPGEDDKIAEISFGEGALVPLIQRKADPTQIPWSRYGVDWVVETSGTFIDPTDEHNLLGHTKSSRGNDTGAEGVLLSAPFKIKKDKALGAKLSTLVYPFNVGQIARQIADPALPNVMSNASCTTNCAVTMTEWISRYRAGVENLLHTKYGLPDSVSVSDPAFIGATTVHGPTNTQAVGDMLAKVDAKNRAATGILPTSTGLSSAIKQLGDFDEERRAFWADSANPFPKSLTAFAMRVNSSASLVYAPTVFTLKGVKKADIDRLRERRDEFHADLMQISEQAALDIQADPYFAGVAEYVSGQDATTSEIVVGSKAGAVYDGQMTQVLYQPDENLIATLFAGWYDNVWGYTAQMERVLDRIAWDLIGDNPAQPLLSQRQEARSESREAVIDELRNSSSLLFWHQSLQSLAADTAVAAFDFKLRLAKGIELQFRVPGDVLNNAALSDGLHRYLASSIYYAAIIYGTDFVAFGTETENDLTARVSLSAIQDLLTNGNLAKIYDKAAAQPGDTSLISLANLANQGRPVQFLTLAEAASRAETEEGFEAPAQLDFEYPGIYVGVDTGGGSSKIGVWENGRQIKLPENLRRISTTSPVFESGQAYVNRVASHLRQVQIYLGRPIDGVGLDMPGAVDLQRNRMVTLGQIVNQKNWQEADVQAALELPSAVAQALGLPEHRVKIRNDMDGVLTGVSAILRKAKPGFFEETGGNFRFDAMGTGHGHAYAVNGSPLTAPTEGGHAVIDFGSEQAVQIFDTEAFTSIPGMVKAAIDNGFPAALTVDAEGNMIFKNIGDAATGVNLPQYRDAALAAFRQFASQYAQNLLLGYLLTQQTGVGDGAVVLLGGGGVTLGRQGELFKQLTLEELAKYGVDGSRIRLEVLEENEILKALENPGDIGALGSSVLIQNQIKNNNAAFIRLESGETRWGRPLTVQGEPVGIDAAQVRNIFRTDGDVQKTLEQTGFAEGRADKIRIHTTVAKPERLAEWQGSMLILNLPISYYSGNAEVIIRRALNEARNLEAARKIAASFHIERIRDAVSQVNAPAGSRISQWGGQDVLDFAASEYGLVLNDDTRPQISDLLADAISIAEASPRNEQRTTVEEIREAIPVAGIADVDQFLDKARELLSDAARLSGAANQIHAAQVRLIQIHGFAPDNTLIVDLGTLKKDIHELIAETSGIYEPTDISIFEDGNALGAAAAERIIALVREKPDAVIILPTGSTPNGMYKALVRRFKEDTTIDFSRVRFFNLDEYIGLKEGHPLSYQKFMEEKLYKRLDEADPSGLRVPKPENRNIPSITHMRQFAGYDPADGVQALADAYDQRLRDAIASTGRGKADLVVLGAGGAYPVKEGSETVIKGGHIGFNEPGALLGDRTQIIQLTSKTKKDTGFRFSNVRARADYEANQWEAFVPDTAITLGVANILESHEVFLLANGEEKSIVIKKAFEDDPDPNFPVTFLKHHANVRWYLDKDASNKLPHSTQPWTITGAEDFDWTPETRRQAILLALKRNPNVFAEGLVQAHFDEIGISAAVVADEFGSIQQAVQEFKASLEPRIFVEHPDLLPSNENVVIISPHPDDDVITSAATMKRLVERGNNVTVVYMVGGANAVRSGDFDTLQKLREAEEAYRSSAAIGTRPLTADEQAALLLEAKLQVRKEEAENGAAIAGVTNTRFPNLPYYRTRGFVDQAAIDPQGDVSVILDMLNELNPQHVFYSAEQDPHGAHGLAADVVAMALQDPASTVSKDLKVWGYRGAYEEWPLEESEDLVVVTFDDEEMQNVKVPAILAHKSQINPEFPSFDPREFWERARDRNGSTGKAVQQLGFGEEVGLQYAEVFRQFTRNDFVASRSEMRTSIYDTTGELLFPLLLRGSSANMREAADKLYESSYAYRSGISSQNVELGEILENYTDATDALYQFVNDPLHKPLYYSFQWFASALNVLGHANDILADEAKLAVHEQIQKARIYNTDIVAASLQFFAALLARADGRVTGQVILALRKFVNPLQSAAPALVGTERQLAEIKKTVDEIRDALAEIRTIDYDVHLTLAIRAAAGLLSEELASFEIRSEQRIAASAALTEAPSGVVEQSAAQDETLDRLTELFRRIKPFMGDYESRRWVTVHITDGITALLPADIADFLKGDIQAYWNHDIAHFDGAAPSDSEQAFAGFDIAVVDGRLLRDEQAREEYFYGIGATLARQPKSRMHQFVISDDDEEAALWQKSFDDQMALWNFAGRYKIEAVTEAELQKRIAKVIVETFSSMQADLNQISLAEFTQTHVSFSSPSRSLLKAVVQNIGWLIVNDLPAYTGAQVLRQDRSLDLASGKDAELVRKLGEIAKVNKVISAMNDLVSKGEFDAAVRLWQEMVQKRFIHQSA